MSFLLRHKYQIFIFVFAFFVLTKFSIDPDLGWHLASGRQFLETGKIITEDQFSWTMTGYKWGNYYFGYEVLLAFLFRSFSHIAVDFLFGILTAFGVLILLPKKLDLVKSLVSGLGITILSFNLATRPSDFSFFMFALTLFFLNRGFFKKKIQALLWVVILGIWVNLHQGFLVGLLVFESYLLIRVYQERKGRFVKLLSMAAGFTGTLLTPFGINLTKTVIFDSAGLKTWTIAEWQPTAVFYPVNFFWVASAILFILILRRKGVDYLWLVMGSFLLALSFLASHSLLFWAAIFIFIVVRSFDLKLDFKIDFWTKLYFALVLCLVFLAFGLNFAANVLESLDLRQGFVNDKYPVEAVDFMKKEKLSQRLFNEYSWGGYLAWQYPETKVFINGRMTGWRYPNGRYILADYLAISRGNCGVLEQYDVRTVLVKKGQDTKCFSDFKKVYEDAVAKVLVKV